MARSSLRRGVTLAIDSQRENIMKTLGFVGDIFVELVRTQLEFRISTGKVESEETAHTVTMGL